MKKCSVLMAALVMAALFLAATGCEDNTYWLDDKLVGTWKENSPKYYPYFDATFLPDGRVYFTQGMFEKYGGTGRWRTHNDTLVITADGESFSVEYTYRVWDQALTLITYDNFEIDCTRQ
jgi:hypothetical protein